MTCYYYLLSANTAPVGSPISLMVGFTTSTSASLSWSPPPQNLLNGILRHYVVLVQEIDSGRNTSLMSIDPQIILNNLHPFYSYNFAVCAVTTDTGPCAQFETVQLPQDGKLFHYLSHNM